MTLPSRREFLYFSLAASTGLAGESCSVLECGPGAGLKAAGPFEGGSITFLSWPDYGKMLGGFACPAASRPV
jgi:hypothetical protein